MRSFIIYILFLILFTNCISDNEPIACTTTAGEINIKLSFGDYASSRSYLSNDGTIKEFRILVFSQNSNGQFLFEKQYVYNDFSPSINNPCIISVKSGLKRFYCFANTDQADMYYMSTGNSFHFNVNDTYTEANIKDIVINQFSYVNPQFNSNDLIPMTGYLQYNVTQSTNQSATIYMTRVVSQVTLNVKLDKALTTGQTFAIKYASIGNNPTYTYLFPQTDNANHVMLPSYDPGMYTNSSSYTPATPIDINTTVKTILTAYLHENPYGIGANSGTGNIPLPNHTTTEGYQGMASRLNIFFAYYNGSERIEKGLLEDIPYLERNNHITITATITPTNSDSENFTININVAPWDNKNEQIPDYQ